MEYVCCNLHNEFPTDVLSHFLPFLFCYHINAAVTSTEHVSVFLWVHRGVKLIFTRGHISFAVAFKGLNVILGLYTCNSGKELGAAARQKQGARPDKTRWRAGFGPRAWCLTPVL